MFMFMSTTNHRTTGCEVARSNLTNFCCPGSKPAHSAEFCSFPVLIHVLQGASAGVHALINAVHAWAGGGERGRRAAPAPAPRGRWPAVGGGEATALRAIYGMPCGHWVRADAGGRGQGPAGRGRAAAQYRGCRAAPACIWGPRAPCRGAGVPWLAPAGRAASPCRPTN